MAREHQTKLTVVSSIDQKLEGGAGGGRVNWGEGNGLEI